MLYKLFENIVLARILYEVSAFGCETRNLGSDPENNTPFSWPASFERITRNFDEKKLTGEGFFRVA
jgi:hypothetical protein